jgi:hypothetical protein
VWLTLPPTMLMLAMTTWSLGLTLWGCVTKEAAGAVAPMLRVEAAVAGLLFVLAAWIVVEALLLVRGTRAGRPEGSVA